MNLYVQQGRVFADNPCDAALKVRQMWGNGKLVMKEIVPGWIEYRIEIGKYEED